MVDIEKNIHTNKLWSQGNISIKNREKTVKTEILDQLEHLDLAVIQAKTELLAPKVLLVLLALMGNAVLPVLLELVVSR